MTGMLSPRPGLEAQNIGLGLVITGLGLVTVVASVSYSYSLASYFLPECDYVTFGSLLSQFRLSSVCLSVCNVGAPYSGGWSFRQNFFTAVYAGHPLISVQNFTEIVLGEPLRRER